MTAFSTIFVTLLTYAEGWFRPGGGKKRREIPEDRVLRELRVEIGIQRWSTIRHLGRFSDGACPPSNADAFLVSDVAYRPRWSLEIAEVREFALDQLPAELSGPARTFLDAALPYL